MTIMAISRGPQKCMRAGDQKHVYNKQWPNIDYVSNQPHVDLFDPHVTQGDPNLVYY